MILLEQGETHHPPWSLPTLTHSVMVTVIPTQNVLIFFMNFITVFVTSPRSYSKNCT